MFRLCASGGTQKEAKLWGIRPGSVYFPGNCLPQCIMVFRIWRMSFSVLQGNHVRLEHRLIGWWILQEKYGVPALLVCSPSVKFTFCLGSTTVRLCKTYIYIYMLDLVVFLGFATTWPQQPSSGRIVFGPRRLQLRPWSLFPIVGVNGEHVSIC